MFFFSSRRRHTRYWRDWSSDVCSSDLKMRPGEVMAQQPVYRTTVTSDNPVGSRANQVTVHVTVTTTVFVYNRSAAGNLRSEERRVGKECRFRWSTYE